MHVGASVNEVNKWIFTFRRPTQTLRYVSSVSVSSESDDESLFIIVLEVEDDLRVAILGNLSGR